MKKIYSFLGAMAIATASMGQITVPFTAPHFQPLPEFSNTKQAIKYSAAKTAGGAIDMRIDPALMVIQSHGGTFGAGGSIVLGANPIFCDSLVRMAYTNDVEHVNFHLNGIVFDPKSISQGQPAASFNPLLSKFDSYQIDSIFIGGIYQRVSGPGIVDTLVIDIVWGDTSNTAVFGKLQYLATDPLARFNNTLLAEKYKVSSPPVVQGHDYKLTAPASNHVRYKIRLYESDTLLVNQTFGRYYPAALSSTVNIPANNGPLTIPANNVVGINYTFVSGMPYSLGDIYFSFDPANNPQVINGFASIQYIQNPPPTSSAAILDYFLDYAPGKNNGHCLISKQRYGLFGSPLNVHTLPTLAFRSMIDLKLQAMSTVSVAELKSKGYELGQNQPNPFTGESTIAYNLAKNAEIVTFRVFDILGHLQLEVYETPTIGIHSIVVKDLAPGVYYYSLDVDGVVTTKKMIVQ